ncbi:hypothetical protein DFH07DRAFT_955782 [Mycena maculata]|uniref:RING-type domain-containing protein n=1 Tax=Mycena maculata TaxID=230809 RepID=A0AAD7JK19_9AGAR|nr:hypothetical protein DFH07DRAFT_955782 [Mycena maculata]
MAVTVSRDNPDGDVFRERVHMDDTGSRPRIIFGPPSTIVQRPTTPPLRTRLDLMNGAAFTATHTRSRRSVVDENENAGDTVVYSLGTAPMSAQGAARTPRAEQRRGQRYGPPEFVAGSRVHHELPLKYRDLWADGSGPSEQHATEAHHKCGICLEVKSHPVSYACGHSHCYTCIRLWLERSWNCPECSTQMTRPPFRHYGEEAWIASEYPEWQDESQVDYSWTGLTFPKNIVRGQV